MIYNNDTFIFIANEMTTIPTDLKPLFGYKNKDFKETISTSRSTQRVYANGRLLGIDCNGAVYIRVWTNRTQNKDRLIKISNNALLKFNNDFDWTTYAQREYKSIHDSSDSDTIV